MHGKGIFQGTEKFQWTMLVKEVFVKYLRSMVDHLWKNDLGILSLVVLIINFPYFQGNFFPVHDTQTNFGMFHYFYSELFFNRELVLWLPFHGYGLSAMLLQVGNLTPLKYLFAIGGSFFQIKDALFIFKLSVVAEQIVFLTGMYLLARLLYAKRSTIFIVCLGAVMSTVWFSQIAFNFYIYYLFPWIFYLILLFFKKERPEFLWLAGIVMLSSWVGGTVLYYLGLWLLIAFVFFGVLCFKYKQSWRCLFLRSFSNIFFFLLFAGVAAICVYCCSVIIREIVFYAPQRSPSGAATSLPSFLTYGGTAYLQEVVKNFFFRGSLFPSISRWDNTVYIGLLPLVFFAWALFRVRNVFFFAFLSAVAVLFLLSFGGFFAEAVYFFPGMHLYRHIAFVYGFVKVLVLICAGFGLDHFWIVRLREKVGYVLVIILSFLLLFDVLSISKFLIADSFGAWKGLKLDESIHFPVGMDDFRKVASWYLFSALAFLIIGAIIHFILKKKEKDEKKASVFFPALVVAALILPFGFDLSTFQVMIHNKVPRISNEDIPFLESVMVSKLQFQEVRVTHPFKERQKKAHDLLRRKESKGGVYQQDSNFIQIDLCTVPDNDKVYFLSRGVDRLLKIGDFSNPSFWGMLGWYYPKIRLVSQGVFVDTVEEAARQIKKSPDLTNIVFLRSTDSKMRLSVNNTIKEDASQNIKVAKFTSNEIVIEADVAGEDWAWLVYTDAFHPGWHATVNGKRTRVYEADLAFKAVRVEKGKNTVRFFFYDGLNSTVAILIALFCIGMGFVFVLVFFDMLLFGPKHIEDLTR